MCGPGPLQPGPLFLLVESESFMVFRSRWVAMVLLFAVAALHVTLGAVLSVVFDIPSNYAWGLAIGTTLIWFAGGRFD